MKKICYLGTLLGLLLMFAACSDDYDNPILRISSETINIETKGGTVTIPVEATVSYSAVSDAKWLEVNKGSSQIIVTAGENGEYNDRMAVVTVKGGGLVRSFEVRQFGQDLSIKIDPESLEFKYTGESKQFTVTTNAPSFEVECDAEWVNLQTDEAGVCTAAVEENMSYNAKKAVVTVKVDGIAVSSIELIQEARPKPAFEMPLFLFGNPTADIKKAEEKRGTKLIDEKDGGTGTLLNYEIDNEVFSGWTYMIQLNRYVNCAMYAKEKKFTEAQKTDFETFLTEHGFVKLQIKGYPNSISMDMVDKDVFINVALQARIELMKDRIENYLMSYFPWQQAAQATFAAPVVKFNKGFNLEQLKDLEKQAGNTFNMAESKMNYGSEGAKKDRVVFEVKQPNQNGEVFREYYVYHPNQKKSGVTQMSCFYEDFRLAFFQGLDAKYYLTNEFIKYAKSQGWKNDGYSAKYDQYYFKNAENQTITVKYLKVSEKRGWLLRISFF